MSACHYAVPTVDIQVHKCPKLKKRKQRCIRRWRKAIFLKCLSIAWDMWEHRNEIKHGTVTPHKQREIDSIDMRIRSLFEGGTRTLTPRYQHWITHHPLDTILGYPINVKQQWVESVELAMQASTRERARLPNQQAQRSLIRTWLASGQENSSGTSVQ